MLLLLSFFLAAACAQTITIRVPGACNVGTEVAITGSATNTSSTSQCRISACSFDQGANTFSCTLDFDFGTSGEVVVAAHLHWKAFSRNGVAFPAGKFLFPVVAGRASDTVTVPAITPPPNMTSALINNPKLAGGQFYINVHGTWAPPSPFGSMGGWITGDDIVINLPGPCNVATERIITGSTSNTSATATCGLGFCIFNIPGSALTCSIVYDFGATGETVVATHIHWKAFNATDGTAFAADKVVLPSTAGTASGVATVTAASFPNLALALLANPTLADNLFYVNVHSNWSPPSPFGAMGGFLTSLVPVSPLVTPPPATQPSDPAPGGGACTFGPFPIPANFVSFSIRLSYDFATFNCATFPPQLAQRMAISTSELIFTRCIAGSVILDASAPPAAVTTLQNQVAAGTSGLPITQFTCNFFFSFLFCD
jgi:hypothetical protein